MLLICPHVWVLKNQVTEIPVKLYSFIFIIIILFFGILIFGCKKTKINYYLKFAHG